MDASERSVLTLRLVAAIVVFAGALWLALLRPSPAIWACAGVSVLMSLVWLAMAMRSRKRLRDPERHRLLLDPDALALIEGPRDRRVPWVDVESIETDEERLVVRVQVRGAEPLVIEPRYGGLGVHDLEAAVRRAHDAAVREGP